MSKILKFGQIEDTKIGCLMLYFSFSNWKEFVRNLIKEEDIYDDEENDFGYEDEPHCTILYGLHHYDSIVEDIKPYLPKLEDINDIIRAAITIFETEEYDVVKFDIVSEKLKDLDKTLMDNFEYTNEYDYHPHMTIAYVKKGEGTKYIQKDIEQVPLFGDRYIYSDDEYNKIEIVNGLD
jgi:2'-5' RNA ligase